MKKTFALVAVFGLVVVTTGGEQPHREISVLGEALVAGTGVWMFPHLFHLDENNTSSLTVTNNSTNITVEVSISLRNREGEEVGENMKDLTHFDLPPKAWRRFNLAELGEEFVGTASLYCKSFSCLAVGSWEFDFGPERRYSVGIPGISTLTQENHWAHSAGESSGEFAVAVFNHLASDNPCRIDHFNPLGELVRREEFVLGKFAQQAEFADVPEGFVGRSELKCAGSVSTISVVQSPINGFPTVGYPMKLTFVP